MIIRMITAGEQTGKIDNMLERISDFLDEEIETILSGLTSLIEPILIVFLGVVVGGIVICMFLPIFKMSEIVNPQATNSVSVKQSAERWAKRSVHVQEYSAEVPLARRCSFELTCCQWPKFYWSMTN